MASEEDFTLLEEEILKFRQLPYSITVEKIEDDIIYTHNPWGNSIQYRKLKKEKGFEMVENSDKK